MEILQGFYLGGVFLFIVILLYDNMYAESSPMQELGVIRLIILVSVWPTIIFLLVPRVHRFFVSRMDNDNNEH